MLEDTLGKELYVRAAVLMQAIADLVHPGEAIRAPARRWIAGELPSPRGYSFTEISDVLGIDADAARERLLSGAARSDVSAWFGRHL